MFLVKRIFFTATMAAALAASTAFPLDSTGRAFEETPDGITLRLSGGRLHVAICADQVIHVTVSPGDEVAASDVPVVIGRCGGVPFTVSSDPATLSISTNALRVEIQQSTGAVRFLTLAGQPILSEQPRDGGSIAPVSLGGFKSCKVRQDFALSSDEALYGLGQHQEGLFNLRDIPVRLLQANTNISIPFLISTKGYGLLWNNAALTDFNQANEAIQLDEKGVGTLHTGPAGEYGFLLGGNQ